MIFTARILSTSMDVGTLARVSGLLLCCMGFSKAFAPGPSELELGRGVSTWTFSKRSWSNEQNDVVDATCIKNLEGRGFNPKKSRHDVMQDREFIVCAPQAQIFKTLRENHMSSPGLDPK